MRRLKLVAGAIIGDLPFYLSGASFVFWAWYFWHMFDFAHIFQYAAVVLMSGAGTTIFIMIGTLVWWLVEDIARDCLDNLQRAIRGKRPKIYISIG